MDVISALEQSYDQTTKLVAGLTPAELDAPSPCAGCDVRATLNHLVGATWMFTLVNQGPQRRNSTSALTSRSFPG